MQSQENAYDLEANIAVLKLYQFNQQYNIDITTQILLKALTNLPHTDFALCKCLLSEQMVYTFFKIKSYRMAIFNELFLVPRNTNQPDRIFS